jgi:N-methylhydantoinase B
MVREAISTELLVKDLSNEDFQARYQCDRFTATVLANRFRYIVKHMSQGYVKVSKDPNSR